MKRDGYCDCIDDNLKINSEGVCTECDVLGCKSCSNETNVCSECYGDFLLKEVENVCVCNEGSKAPNEKYECSDCFVEACKSCISSDPYKCR